MLMRFPRLLGDPWLDRVFQEWPEREAAEARGYPALNAWEDAEHYFVEAELPGMKMEDLDLTITGNELTIKGERKLAQAQGARYHRRERPAGAFARLVRLPAEIDAAKAEANLRDGVLSVTLPKSPAVKPKKIQVKVAR